MAPARAGRLSLGARAGLWLFAALAWAGTVVPARAADPPILNVASVPNLDAAGRISYGRFLQVNLPRAFALSPGGKMGWYGGAATIEEAREKALTSCAAKGGAGCAIYAEDLRIVWPGKESAPPPPPPGPLIETIQYAFVPDPRFIWRGPAAATGLYVWGHGKNNMMDSRGQQPSPYVRAFNNAGFDIVRFDREPSRDYSESAVKWLRSGLATLRSQGWKVIVSGGQSRGGWTSLDALNVAGLADAVIATAPASFSGTDNTGAMYSIVHAAAVPTTRVAIAVFDNDPYVTDMDRRAALYRDDLPSRVGAFLLIDRPKAITGHGGGNTVLFAQHYADCLIHFVMDRVPPTSCPAPAR